MTANFADESGGALFNIGSLAVINTVFSENTTADGGLDIMNEDPPLGLWNATFDGNMLSCPPEEYNDFYQVSTVVVRRWVKKCVFLRHNISGGRRRL